MKLVLENDEGKKFELEMKKCPDKYGDWAQIFLNGNRVMSIFLSDWREGLSIHFDIDRSNGRCYLAEVVPRKDSYIIKVNGPKNKECDE